MVEANGIRINVYIEGQGPDVILLHGFPDSALVWRFQIPALVQAGYRVIVPDLRGSGDSEAPIGKACYKLDMLIRDVVCLMDSLEIRKAKLVGHDWGAILGWFIAIEHPDRVDRYVAISVGHPVSFERGGFEQKVRSWYALTFQMPVLPEVMIMSFNWTLMRLFTQNHPEIINWINDKGRPGRLTAGINWYRANAMRMLFGRTGHAKVPVLGIWSDRDLYLTENQMKTSALYMDASWKYERIENASHWLQLDVPEHLSRILIEYFCQPLEGRLTTSR